MSDKEKLRKEARGQLGQSFVTWANAGMLGFHMITGPLLGVFIGYYADKWLDTRPVCIIIGLIMGLIAGGLNLYRDLRRILRELDAEDARNKLRRLGQGLPPVPEPAKLSAEERAAEEADPSGVLPGYGSGPAGEAKPADSAATKKNDG